MTERPLTLAVSLSISLSSLPLPKNTPAVVTLPLFYCNSDYRLKIAAWYEADAGVGATLAAGTSRAGSQSATRTLFSKPSFAHFSFSIAGIPISVDFDFALTASLALGG